ncbi:MAG: hypothetical protein ACE5HV_07725 [Acidobacteriota bacterium]
MSELLPTARTTRWLSLLRSAHILALAMVMAGCGASGNIDDTQNAVVLVIDSITQVSNPFGDILTSSGSILDDTVDVVFSAHLKSPSPPPGSPLDPTLQDIILERYEVTFVRTDGGTAVPAGFQRGMSLRVRLTPQGDVILRESTASSLVIAPATEKSQPPISFLIDPGFEPSTGFVNIQVNATLRFFGRTIAGDKVSVSATIGINFADFGDNNS